jgi:hypothetical protein
MKEGGGGIFILGGEMDHFENQRRAAPYWSCTTYRRRYDGGIRGVIVTSRCSFTPNECESEQGPQYLFKECPSYSYTTILFTSIQIS